MAAAVLGCQPLADFRTKVRFPDAVDIPLDSLQFQLEFRGRAFEREPTRITHGSSGVVVEYSFSDVGPIMLSVWADLDRDGIKSPGDLEGQFDREFRLGDAGLCSLGYSETPDIVLKPWTP